MKYHIKKDGTVGVCNATVQDCPLGGADEHYSSMDEAYKAANEKFADKYGYINEGSTEKMPPTINSGFSQLIMSDDLFNEIMSSRMPENENYRKLDGEEVTRLNDLLGKKIERDLGSIEEDSRTADEMTGLSQNEVKNLRTINTALFQTRQNHRNVNQHIPANEMGSFVLAKKKMENLENGVNNSIKVIERIEKQGDINTSKSYNKKLNNYLLNLQQIKKDLAEANSLSEKVFEENKDWELLNRSE